MPVGELYAAVREYFSKDLKVKLIVIMGIAGMVLIFLSQFFGREDRAGPETATTEGATAVSTNAEYIESLETKLLALISEIDGVGRAQVMVTLESGVEYVYALEEKRNLDRSEDSVSEEGGRTSQKENVEQTYLLVDGESGKEPLVRTELEPKVQGVVIVCEGADNVRVERDLISVVTTALGVSSARVCVVKIS